ncbi:MAG TPA: ATP-binding protein [Phenylobacterium sp.]|jgi:two-component sensor histidine kinase
MARNQMADAARRTVATSEFESEPCPRRHCTIVAEADHRIANHLAMLAGQVHLRAAELACQADAPNRESVCLLLLGLEAEISAVARLHRLLSAGGSKASADLADQLHEVCATINTGVSGAVVVEDLSRGHVVDAELLLPVTQIVAEVITNAVKHAYPAGKGTILVSLREVGAGKTVIEVVDHGSGFPPGFDPLRGGGLGFRVVRALAKQIHAVATFQSSGLGVRFQLALPPV